MKKKIICDLSLLLLPAVAVIFNALPNAVRMNWMGDYTTYCSGFSLIPVGYANYCPMLSGIGAIVLCILALVRMKRNARKLNRVMCVIGLFSAVLCVLPALFGGITRCAIAMAICLISECTIAYLISR